MADLDAPALAPLSIEQYIRQGAVARGIDPDYAVRVANTEGGVGGFKKGDGGLSGGPFQLYTGGGLGNSFMKDTGLDPLEPANVYKTIDYSLDYAAARGGRFDPNVWHGARSLEGGGGNQLAGTSPAVARNPLGGTTTALLSTPANPLFPASSPAASGVPVLPADQPRLARPALGNSLALMALLAAGTHKISPVDYDPFKLQPKVSL